MKNIINKIKHIVVVGFVLFTITSCEDYLSPEPSSVLNAATSFENEDDLESEPDSLKPNSPTNPTNFEGP